jgi:hypothetical protein
VRLARRIEHQQQIEDHSASGLTSSSRRRPPRPSARRDTASAALVTASTSAGGVPRWPRTARKARTSRSIPRTSRLETRSERHALSSCSSAWMPPAPISRSGPNTGSLAPASYPKQGTCLARDGVGVPEAQPNRPLLSRVGEIRPEELERHGKAHPSRGARRLARSGGEPLGQQPEPRPDGDPGRIGMRQGPEAPSGSRMRSRNGRRVRADLLASAARAAAARANTAPPRRVMRAWRGLTG